MKMDVTETYTRKYGIVVVQVQIVVYADFDTLVSVRKI